MKKIVILLLALSGAANAQNISASKLPSAVKTEFIKNHPGLKAAWEKEEGNYEAGFTLNGIAILEIYTANSLLTESEITMKVSALPASVVQYIKQH
ncbi:MAG TPA: hypothetical protein DIT07_07385 [Sphingobacteriaceae bacterium]|nr:hypothetical protein [Sphingobacteriaceae bacterium]